MQEDIPLSPASGRKEKPVRQNAEFCRTGFFYKKVLDKQNIFDKI